MAEYICPHCGRPVYDDDALRCLYCGESLNRKAGFLGGIKYASPRIALAAVILLVLISFMLLITR
jgi:hypothetical protein